MGLSYRLDGLLVGELRTDSQQYSSTLVSKYNLIIKNISEPYTMGWKNSLPNSGWGGNNWQGENHCIISKNIYLDVIRNIIQMGSFTTPFTHTLHPQKWFIYTTNSCPDKYYIMSFSIPKRNVGILKLTKISPFEISKKLGISDCLGVHLNYCNSLELRDSDPLTSGYTLCLE